MQVARIKPALAVSFLLFRSIEDACTMIPTTIRDGLTKSVRRKSESMHNFHEFYEQHHDNSACQSVLYQMNVLNRRDNISAAEWEISRLYCAMDFVKAKNYVDSAIDKDDDDDDEKEEPVHRSERQESVHDNAV
jgi:hypothetical protein